MASRSAKNPTVFPVGTTVAAYPASNWPGFTVRPSGSPVGSPTESAVVAADSTVTFTTLTDLVAYYLYASVGGVDRYVAFTPGAPAAGRFGSFADGQYAKWDAAAGQFVGVDSPAVAPLTLTGSSDAKQLLVKGNGTQTNPIFEVQKSDATSFLRVSNAGQVALPVQGPNGGLLLGGDVALYREVSELFGSAGVHSPEPIEAVSAGVSGAGISNIGQVAAYPETTAEIALSIGLLADPGPRFSIDGAGLLHWDDAANQQTTVGAAGGASAPPATPTKYLKVKDSAGTTLVIPAYAAA